MINSEIKTTASKELQEEINNELKATARSRDSGNHTESIRQNSKKVCIPKP